MIALLQRVTEARVDVKQKCVGRIGKGLLILIGVEKDDTQASADRLVERFLGYRVFADDQDKMNLSVMNIEGGVLLVPQFTLAADTSSGMRPGFSSAASPEKGKQLFEYLVEKTRQTYDQVETGQFGANMQVSLINDGPVTFRLSV